MEKSRHLPGDPKHHISSFKSHLIVYGTLIILTILTVLVSVAKLEWGALPVILALLIASAKSVVVLLFFMHVKFENKMIKLFILLSFVIFGILIFFTSFDYITRQI